MLEVSERVWAAFFLRDTDRNFRITIAGLSAIGFRSRARAESVLLVTAEAK